jgi:hypothetical protein
MKGMEVPPIINPQIVFSVTNFDQVAFESFPDFIKEKIQSSNEYKALSVSAPAPAVAEPAVIDEDDLPW